MKKILDRIKEILDEKINHRYLLKNKQPRNSQPVVFQTKYGNYASFHIYASYDKERNIWTGHSGITDGVDIVAHPDDIWWEF